MSIYATWLSIDDDSHTERCAKWVRVPEAEGWEDERVELQTHDGRYYRRAPEAACTCGERAPIVYQGSHVNPGEDDPRGGFVMVCAIPNHCHPAARRNDDQGKKVWFLRLSVREAPATYHGGEPGDATVVLDRKQVEELHDTLTAWLKAEDVA